MSKAVGCAPSTIYRIWQTFRLKPHHSETLSAVRREGAGHCGPYLDPQERALALSVDEKSHVQAFDRTQPLLRPGQAVRRIHDYKRNVRPFCSQPLDVAAGKVIGKCFRHHRSEEFHKFLNYIGDDMPPMPTSSWTTARPTRRSATGSAPACPLHPDIRLAAGRAFFGLLTEKRSRRAHAGRSRASSRPSTPVSAPSTTTRETVPLDQIGGRNSSFDSTVSPANAGNWPSLGQKYMNQGSTR